MLFSTIRIEASSDSGTSVGTGFIAGYKIKDNNYIFLVTNRHVIEGYERGKFFFTKSDGTNPLIGERYDVELDNFQRYWKIHPNLDIAIMPLVPILNKIIENGGKIYFKTIPLDLIPSKEQTETLTALEEITFLGYPNGIYDEKNLLPLFRKGITATPVSLDYNNLPEFLIDASVFPGSSGSPVFILNQGAYATPNGLTIGGRIFFMGILSQAFKREEKGDFYVSEIPTKKENIVLTPQMLDLGIVIKSSEIKKFLEQTIDDFNSFMERKKAEQKQEKIENDQTNNTTK